MTTLLTIDPGKWTLGWAVWSDHSLEGWGLIRAGLSRVPEAPSWQGAGQLGAIAMAHVRNLRPIPGSTRNQADSVVVEEMAHYPGQHQKTADAKAADLLVLQAIGGVVGGSLAGPEGVRFVRAATWKGAVPKQVTRGRVVAILRTDERTHLERDLAAVPKSLHHNVFDVVGIGLWYLQRMKGRASPVVSL